MTSHQLLASVQKVFFNPTDTLSTWIRRVLQFVNIRLSRLTPPDAADPVPFALGTAAAISLIGVVHRMVLLILAWRLRELDLRSTRAICDEVELIFALSFF